MNNLHLNVEPSSFVVGHGISESKISWVYEKNQTHNIRAFAFGEYKVACTYYTTFSTYNNFEHVENNFAHVQRYWEYVQHNFEYVQRNWEYA